MHDRPLDVIMQIMQAAVVVGLWLIAWMMGIAAAIFMTMPPPR